jgi:hypothetical protein
MILRVLKMKQTKKTDDDYEWTDVRKKQLRLTITLIIIVFLGTCLLAINVLGGDTKTFKEQTIKIKDKNNVEKQVLIKDITKNNNDLTITLNENGYTMFELYQIKIESEKILKEKTSGKTTFKGVLN